MGDITLSQSPRIIKIGPPGDLRLCSSDDDTRQFLVSSDTLIHISPVFRALLSSNFSEGQQPRSKDDPPLVCLEEASSAIESYLRAVFHELSDEIINGTVKAKDLLGLYSMCRAYQTIKPFRTLIASMMSRIKLETVQYSAVADLLSLAVENKWNDMIGRISRHFIDERWEDALLLVNEHDPPEKVYVLRKSLIRVLDLPNSKGEINLQRNNKRDNILTTLRSVQGSCLETPMPCSVVLSQEALFVILDRPVACSNAQIAQMACDILGNLSMDGRLNWKPCHRHCMVPEAPNAVKATLLASTEAAREALRQMIPIYKRDDWLPYEDEDWR